MTIDPPLHGLPPQIIEMIRGEVTAALICLNRIMMNEDSRLIVAVVVLLEEILPEFAAQGRKPWRAIPWLDCAIQLLQRGDTADVNINGAREHVSAARDLLARD